MFALLIVCGLACVHQATVKGRPGRMMLFIGGPPTHGPGQVVGVKQEETIRSHNDLLKGQAPFFTKAVKVCTLVCVCMVNVCACFILSHPSTSFRLSDCGYCGFVASAILHRSCDRLAISRVFILAWSFPLCPQHQYYEGLSKRAADNGHVVDLFACSLDQVRVGL